jgi:ATP-dependent exoDNAse (exonuclease V) alpha subunit
VARSRSVSGKKSSKPIPEVLPGITLNQQQWQVLQRLEKFVKSKEKLHLLTGFAGTGKTTLLQALIKRLRDKSDFRNIVFTAFSNKATKVLENMSSQWDLGIDCMTCCKLLGLKPDIDTATGKQVFKPDYNSENKFDKYRLVVVDEASMINEEMWLLLTAAVTDLHKQTQILFVGDVAQLPPINERESLVFTQIYDRSDLNEVVRYGGAIAILAESIRNALHSPNLPQFASNTNAEQTEGVVVVAPPAWEKLMIRAFQSEAYQRDPDYVRAVAYTNARVNQLNQQIRTAIYGTQTSRFVVGERLVANAPFMVNDALILQNSSECQVLDVASGKDGSWHVWYLHVLTDEGKLRNLTVLHELSQQEFTQKLDLYAKEKRWREFWDLKSLFADLSYAYCLTIHKSQGSTFQNVFVDVPNALRNRNIRERNQLLYVAVTRAAKRLFVPSHGGA